MQNIASILLWDGKNKVGAEESHNVYSGEMLNQSFLVELPAKHYAYGTISLLTSVNDADTPQATAVEASTE